MVRPMLTVLALMVAATSACDYRAGGFVGVTPPATALVFVVQPTDVAVGTSMVPAVQVHLRNAANQTVSNATATITLSIVPGSGSPGAVLSGASPQTTVGGVAVFSNLRIDAPGNGYQLLATASGYPTVASTQFSVTP